MPMRWLQLGEDEYSSELGRVVRGGFRGTEWWFFPAAEAASASCETFGQAGPWLTADVAMRTAEQLCETASRKESVYA